MTKRSRVPLEKIRIQLIQECQTTPRNILVFQMGNWMLKASTAKIQSGLKTSTSLSYFDVKKKITLGIVRNPCSAGLHVQNKAFMCLSLFFSREGQVTDGKPKQKNDFLPKSRWWKLQHRQTKKLSVGSSQGSRERTTRQQLSEKCNPDNQLINILCAWWNKKSRKHKRKKGRKNILLAVCSK